MNTQDGFYGNALQVAATRGHDKSVQVLVTADADVNAQGGDYGNALQAAAERGYDKVVQVLVTAGANFNTQGGEMATHSARHQLKGTRRWCGCYSRMLRT